MREGSRSKSTRQAAVDRVAQLERPDSIGKVQWRQVKALLFLIASYYPKPYPSEATLAERMMVDERTIRRYVRAARDAGLLQVTPDAGRKSSRRSIVKTNLYAIFDRTNCPIAYRTVCPPKPLRGTTYPSGEKTFGLQETASLDPSGDSASGRISTHTEERTVRQDPSERERDVSANPDPPRPKKKPPRRAWPSAAEAVGDSDSQTRARRAPRKTTTPVHRELADYFATRWDEMTADLRPEFRKIRALESYALVKTYHAAHWSTLDPEWVKREMDRFINAVATGREQVKPGQSAWMRFTGQWGRQLQAVDDPTVDIYAAFRKPKA